jgi:hypothetical protein
MARIKLDGVIEAVRYDPAGRIRLVRAYRRRGPIWSDRVLLDRRELSTLLNQGKHFAIGSRKTGLGSVFDAGENVRQIQDQIISGEMTGRSDLLHGAPVF